MTWLPKRQIHSRSYRSAPQVSQIVTLTSRGGPARDGLGLLLLEVLGPPTRSVLDTMSMLSVADVVENLFSANRRATDVFPTPASPITSTLNSSLGLSGQQLASRCGGNKQANSTYGAAMSMLEHSNLGHTEHKRAQWFAFSVFFFLRDASRA